MAIYIFNIMVAIILGILFLYMYKGKAAKKIYFSIITLQLALVAGLRGYSVGWDTRNYISHFVRASNYDLMFIFTNDFSTEKGYILFQYFISKISTNPTVLFLMIAILYCFSVGSFIYKNSKNPILSYVIFISMGFYTFSMTALRQTIAIGIILFSFEFIKKRKFIPFLLLVLLASTFHYSALVFLPFYFIGYKKFTRPYVLLTLSTIPLVFVFRDQLFSILNQISGYGYSALEKEGPTTLFMLLILVFIGGIIQRKSILNKEKDNTLYFNSTYMSIILATMAFIHPATLRVGYYYMLFLVLFIPEIIHSLSDKRIKAFAYIAVSLALLFLYIRNLNPSSPFVPYEFFWRMSQ